MSMEIDMERPGTEKFKNSKINHKYYLSSWNAGVHYGSQASQHHKKK